MNMAGPEFEVIVSGGHINPEVWNRADQAQQVGLSDEQKEVARRMGLSEEAYARGVVALQLGEEYQRDRGRVLGQRIQEMLRSLGPEYSLTAVIRQGTELRWIARIEAAGKSFAVALPFDLVDDVVDSGSGQDMDRLKNLVLFGVGRQDLIFKH
jgi:hypothetical protein